MGGDVLNQSDFIEHNNLRDEGDGFKPETVTPGELPGCKSTVYYQSHHESCRQEHFEVREVIS